MSGAKIHLNIDRRNMLREEIDSSIYLYFEEQFIGAHVLLWASNDVMRPLLKREGKISFADEMEGCLKPEAVKSWRDLIRRDYNYFKHADRDPDAILERFSPWVTGVQMLIAALDYRNLYGKVTVPMMMGVSWCLARNQKFVAPEGQQHLDSMIEFSEEIPGQPFLDSLEVTRKKLELFRKNKEESFAALSPAVIDEYEIP
jgi:hypothetical protein